LAFHVEISSGFRQRARAFNLDESSMRREVLDPWIRGRRITLGDKDFEPRDSRLVILEGPALADTDLSLGRGWSSAEKVSENVTRRLVEAATAPAGGPTVAVLAGGSAETDLQRMLERLELSTVPWAELRARILGPPVSADGPGFAAVLVIEGPAPSPSWLFDAGLARGALGARAVVVQLGDAVIPAQLAGVDVMRIEPGEEGSIRALRDRLTK
jgi:hypothetical protein